MGAENKVGKGVIATSGMLFGLPDVSKKVYWNLADRQ